MFPVDEETIELFDGDVNRFLEECLQSDWSGGAGATAAPQARRWGASPLPCLLVHNVTERDDIPSEKSLLLSAKWGRKSEAAKRDRNPLGKLGKPLVSNRDKKTAETLFLNAGHLLQRNLSGCAFVTITTPQNLSYWTKEGWTEARKRFRSWLGHKSGFESVFGAGRDFCRVIEPQRRGAIHWHLLVDTGADIRSGVDWEAFKVGDYRTASPALRGMWARMRESAKRYKLGRTEILPIRCGSWEASARYVGKYISKGIMREAQEGICDGVFRPKHSRRVGYSVGWRVATLNFAWLASGADWRKGVELLAGHVGAADLSDLKNVLGPRWALLNRDVILNGLPQLCDPEEPTPF